MSDSMLAKAMIAAALIQSDYVPVKDIIESAIAAADRSGRIPTEDIIKGAIRGAVIKRAESSIGEFSILSAERLRFNGDRSLSHQPPTATTLVRQRS